MVFLWHGMGQGMRIGFVLRVGRLHLVCICDVRDNFMYFWFFRLLAACAGFFFFFFPM